jgi:hypothetical protein
MEGKQRAIQERVATRFGYHFTLATRGAVCVALLASAAYGLTGCSPKVELPYPNFVEGLSTPSEPSDKADAFTDYIAAGEDFTKQLGPHQILLSKSSFTPLEQSLVEKAAAEPLKKIKSGLGASCHIPYSPAGSEGATRERAALNLLSKVLIWRIEKACEAESYDGAIQTTVLASKFGFDLAAGLPDDASLGLLTVDHARQAIASSLPEMSVIQLEMLGHAMKTVYLNRPSMTTCYESASKDSLQEVQFIQDAYRTENYDGLVRQFGSVAKEMIPTLKELHRQAPSRRVAFFNGLADQAKDEVSRTIQDSNLPVASRPIPPTGIPAVERPWKKIARRLLGATKPLLAMNDATSARTQLLILEAEIIRSRKTNGRTKLIVDPYSGQPFIYRTNGSDYKLYSVGEDLVDNDGETDETFSTPDLKLERTLH